MPSSINIIKSIMVTLVLIFFQFAQAQYNWQLKHPLPQANKIKSLIVIPGTNNLAAVAYNGVFMSSADQGVSWQVWQDESNLGATFEDVFFTDSLTGYIAARDFPYGLVYKTTDGGSTWTNVLNYINPDSVSPSQFQHIHFRSDQVGYVTGAADLLLKTTDAGNSWFSDSITPITSYTLGPLYFLNDSVGHMVGSFGTLITADGGSTWTITDSLVRGDDIFFISDNIGYIVGDNYDIYKTSNGGISWVTQDSLLGQANIYGSGSYNSVYFFNADTGIICGSYERLKTVNGGLTWVNQNQNSYWMQNGVAFINGQVGFIGCGGGVILKTTDSGDSWSDLIGTDGYIYDIDCIGAGTCFAAGSIEYLMRSDDYGETWIIDTVFNRSAGRIQFVNNNLGFATGGYNQIYRTMDGGSSWDSIVIGSGDSMLFGELFFKDESVGFLAGLDVDSGLFGYTYRGFMLESIDTGSTWTRIYEDPFFSPFGRTFHLIRFTTDSIGFAIGPAKNLRTTDGGTTWNDMTSLLPNNFFDCSYPSDSTWYVCDNTKMYKTTDAGDSWTQKTVSTGTLTGIHFIDENNGIGVGYAGSTSRTINGGDSWYTSFNQFSNGLVALFFFNDSVAIAGGAFSTIVKTYNAGGEFCTSQDSLNILGNTLLCDGDTANLDAGVFSTYQWSTADSTQIINATSAGTYWVDVVNAYGCDYRDTVVLAYETNLLNIGADTLICEGESLTLDAGAGYTSYLWSDGSVFQTITTDTTGTFWIEVQSSNGCNFSDSISITVTAVIVDLGADTTICDGDSITLDAGSGYASYLWSDGSVFQTITTDTTGFYSIEVQSSDGCLAQDTVQVSVQVCSGSEELQPGFGLSIYPNPSAGVIAIKGLNVNNGLRVIVFDFLGKNVHDQILLTNQLDLSKLSKGTYLLSINSEGMTFWERITLY